MANVYQITHEPVVTGMNLDIPSRPDSYLLLDGGGAYHVMAHRDAGTDDPWGFVGIPENEFNTADSIANITSSALGGGVLAAWERYRHGVLALAALRLAHTLQDTGAQPAETVEQLRYAAHQLVYHG